MADKEKKLPDFDAGETAEIEFRIGGMKPILISMSKGRARTLCRNCCKKYDWNYKE